MAEHATDTTLEARVRQLEQAAEGQASLIERLRSELVTVSQQGKSDRPELDEHFRAWMIATGRGDLLPDETAVDLPVIPSPRSEDGEG